MAGGVDGILVASVNGRDVTLGEVFRKKKIFCDGSLVEDAVTDALLGEALRENGFRITDGELQGAADEFRRSIGLLSATETHEWLKESGLTPEDLEARMEWDLSISKLRKKVTEGKIDAHFREHRQEFDSAALWEIVVAERALADEILLQVEENPASIFTLAAKHSTRPEARLTGGFIGIVPRKSLRPEIETAVFAATPGKVIGPLATDLGYHVIKVLGIQQGELTDGVRDGIADALFADWMEKRAQKAQVIVKLGS